MNKLVIIRGWFLALLSACAAMTRGPTWTNISSGLTEADSDANWTTINRGLDQVVATHAPVNSLIVDSDCPDVLYLGTSRHGVFKTSDGGATWATFNDCATFLDVRVMAVVRGASPTVYAGTGEGVFKIIEQRKLGTPIRKRRARSEEPLGVQFTRGSAR
jgi:hypothetical protein